MKRDQYEKEAYRLIVRPALILIGMFVAGSLINSFLGTTGAFSYILLLVGGIPAIALYFKKELAKSD